MSLDDHTPTEYFGPGGINWIHPETGKSIRLHPRDFETAEARKQEWIRKQDLLTERGEDAPSVGDIIDTVGHHGRCSIERTGRCICDYLAQWDNTEPFIDYNADGSVAAVEYGTPTPEIRYGEPPAGWTEDSIPSGGILYLPEEMREHMELADNQLAGATIRLANGDRLMPPSGIGASPEELKASIDFPEIPLGMAEEISAANRKYQPGAPVDVGTWKEAAAFLLEEEPSGNQLTNPSLEGAQLNPHLVDSRLTQQFGPKPSDPWFQPGAHPSGLFTLDNAGGIHQLQTGSFNLTEEGLTLEGKLPDFPTMGFNAAVQERERGDFWRASALLLGIFDACLLIGIVGRELGWY